MNSDILTDIIINCEQINGIHCHVGSNLTEDLLAKGLRRAVDFVLNINNKCGYKKIKYFDMGGGLKIERNSDEILSTFNKYSIKLKNHVPELFNQFEKVCTEFGLSFHGKNVFIASQAEYVLTLENKKVVTCQVGSDLLVRAILKPSLHNIRIEHYSKNGELKTNNNNYKKSLHKIVGPLCFAGDTLTESNFNEINEGDWLVIPDQGGNA